MADAYEEMADMMGTTLAGQMAGLSREGFIALFKAKFPVEADFRAEVAKAKAEGERMVAHAQMQVPPGHVTAVAYSMDTRPTDGL